MNGKTFPAFPPRRGAVRGDTWWGRAWTKAMEDTSLDSGRLARGRTYARTGRVGPITVSPGRISAPVHGTDVEPYETRVFVERLSESDWDRFLDEVASRAGHIAALLDGEMPTDLVTAAAEAGVRLLPTVGDLEPECSCADWGYPCKHAAALCYQTAWLLDQDPFVLLLLRGKGRGELLDALQQRQESEPSGTPAAKVFGTEPAPLPSPPPLASTPVVTPQFPAAPGVDADALTLLVRNAAARARDLLGGDTTVLSPTQDAIRMAATLGDDAPWPRERLDARTVAAWRYGGRIGLRVLEEAWNPPKHAIAQAQSVLDDLASTGERGIRRWRNRWTLVDRDVQLRYGPDGRWYPYRLRGGRWWPAGPPEADPGVALADLLGQP